MQNYEFKIENRNYFSRGDLTFWALRCLDYKKVLPLCEILTQIDYEE
jgi:hypothetical protein